MGPTKEKTAIKYISEVYNARSVKKSDTSETLLKIWNLDPNPSDHTSQSVNPTRLSIPTIIYHPDNWPGPTGPSVSISQSIRPNQSIQPAICHQSIISSNLSIIPSRRVIHIYHSHNTPTQKVDDPLWKTNYQRFNERWSVSQWNNPFLIWIVQMADQAIWTTLPSGDICNCHMKDQLLTCQLNFYNYDKKVLRIN